MPDVPSLPARRLAGRCLTVKAALLAGLLALQAAAGAAFAQTAAATAPAASGASATATAPSAPAATSAQPTTPQPGVDTQVQSLKSDVLDLNRDLFVLEQELLYPANTQVAVFVSMDAGTFFGLDTVQLKIDGKEVANYLYTPREVHALVQGGVQRLYVGNLKVGKHEIVAFFTGKGPHSLDYTRGATLDFQKDIGAKYLELTITDDQSKLQPQFRIKDWE
ncbi:MAG TPA: hypothetical protein VMU52_01305 [Steroidobacteraceae bacterium]|nr:hypothetical protein [Steroidobacteraceae bacterium]